MTSIDQPLNGKILLLTGGASGIGFAVTKQAHHLGARLLVADLKTTPDFDTFAQGKDDILYVQADVSHWPDFDKLFASCEEKWGDIPDAYAICAGLFDPPFSNFWLDPEEESGYKQVDVNVNHPIKLTRLAIRKTLGKGKRASLCIISSIGGLGGNISCPLYCATKHAIVGFVKSMKDTEALTGVKVTTLCPGRVLTPLFDQEKTKQYSMSKETALNPDQCATSLLDLLQKGEYGCGTVLEVSLAGTRVIPEWGVEAPEMSKEVSLDGDFVEKLMEPIKRAVENDKAVK